MGKDQGTAGWHGEQVFLVDAVTRRWNCLIQFFIAHRFCCLANATTFHYLHHCFWSAGTRGCLHHSTVGPYSEWLKPAVFAQFKTNPESFIAQACRLINEQKATMVIEHLAYDPLEDTFDLDIFTARQAKQDFTHAGEPLQRHIYDYVITDSNIERQFVKELDG